jgi:hypothetical protein
MRPTDRTIECAQLALAASPNVQVLYTPIAFPAKEYGIWTAEQTVVDAAEIAVTRDGALRLACALLGADQDGTIGWVAHRRNDHWAVFEDILTAADFLRLEVTQ